LRNLDHGSRCLYAPQGIVTLLLRQRHGTVTFATRVQTGVDGLGEHAGARGQLLTRLRGLGIERAALGRPEQREARGVHVAQTGGEAQAARGRQLRVRGQEGAVLDEVGQVVAELVG